jgi:glycine betaine/proline transport system substrate-binding protein
MLLKPSASSRRAVLMAFAAAAVVATAVPVSANEMPGAGKTVRPACAAWDTFWFGGIILQTGLERLGYKIAEPKALQGAALYQALSQHDVDFTADVVLPNAGGAIERAKDTIALAGPVVQPGSVSGFLVDKATAEKHDIVYVTDLLDPKKAALFSEGDSRARMIGPNPGWNDDSFARNYIKELGLEKAINMVQGEYNILVADTVARYRAGKPVMLYAWYPNTATVQLTPGKDEVFLQVKPEQAKPNLEVKDMLGCTKGANPCNTGWSPTTYMVGMNSTFAKENPAAVKFFSLVKMKLSDRVEQNTKMMVGGEKSEADLKRHAMEWISRNQKDFDGWVAEARTAK